MLKELIEKNRCYRRFYQEEKLEKETLLELVELARLTSSGANLQPIKYVLSCEDESNNRIFPYLKWAGYLQDWDGPEEGEKPSAYMVLLLDKQISANCFWDHGLAAQSILLGATERGLGGCMFGAFDKKGLAQELKLSEHFELLMVIALGKPRETVVLEVLGDSGDVKYWRDENRVHHVPKRRLDELIVEL